MPVTFPAVKNALSAALLPTITSGASDSQRYFLTFDPVLNSYCALDTAFTPTGDFEVEVYFSTTNTLNITYFFNAGVSNNYIRLDAAGAVRFRINNGATSSTCQSLNGYNDGKLHRLRASLSSGVQTLQIDNDASIINNSPVSAQINFGEIGRSVSNYFDGILADVSLTDLVTASNSRIFPLAVGAGATENSTINSGSITINNLTNRELFTFDEDNNQWVANDGSPIIEVA